MERGRSSGRPGRGSGFRGQGGPPRGDQGGRGGSRGQSRGSPSRGGSPARGGRGGSPSVFAPTESTELSTRLTDQSQDALVQSFKNLTTKVEYPLRPGWGRAGAPTKVRANFFALKYPKNAVYHDYTVTITPAIENKNKKRRLFELLEQHDDFKAFTPDIVHDHSQRIVSRRALPQPLQIVIVYHEEGEQITRASKSHTIQLIEPRELKTEDLDRYLAGQPAFVDYNTQPIISALNLVTSFQASKRLYICGKNRYFYRGETFDLAPGLEAIRGFYSSVRPTFKQLMVNVNVCMSAFYVPASRLSDAFQEYQRKSYGSNPAFFFEKIRVSMSYLGYRKRATIKSFSSTPANKQIFQCDELGGKVSVAEYFKRKYKIDLRFPHLPSVNIGAQKDVFVPPELCEIIPGQSFRGVLSPQATAAMIQFACKPPSFNAQAITGEGLDRLGLKNGAPAMGAFNVKVDDKMTVVPARYLPPPQVTYRSGTKPAQGGGWNILNVNFIAGANLSQFATLVLPDGERDDFRDPNDPELRDVVTKLLNKFKSSGMNVVQGLPPLRFTSNLSPSTREDPFRFQALQQIKDTIKTFPAPPRMLLIFMANKDPHIFPGLKKMLDVELGVPNVCMLMSKAKKPNGQDQYFSNIALKVNAKLRGTNHRIDEGSLLWLRNTMLVGMDVTHPGPGAPDGIPSIAAAVASCEPSFTQYPASLALQEKSNKEMIKDVRRMMVERLKLYQQVNNRLPERIYVFRDGVSEGQFEQVQVHERLEIQAAIREFPGPKPKLSIIICGKRHHTRFYPTDEAGMDKTGNTKAGLVVDRGVTAVYEFDFYLQAHSALQGSVRPTHYTCIYDENGLGADELQQGINSISYLWARATKSVSLVPPAYWADRAAERARCYLHELFASPDGSPLRKMDKELVRARAEQVWGAGVHDRVKDTMFYL